MHDRVHLVSIMCRCALPACSYWKGARRTHVCVKQGCTEICNWPTIPICHQIKSLMAAISWKVVETLLVTRATLSCHLFLALPPPPPPHVLWMLFSYQNHVQNIGLQHWTGEEGWREKFMAVFVRQGVIFSERVFSFKVSQQFCT